MEGLGRRGSTWGLTSSSRSELLLAALSVTSFPGSLKSYYFALVLGFEAPLTTKVTFKVTLYAVTFPSFTSTL